MGVWNLGHLGRGAALQRHDDGDRRWRADRLRMGGGHGERGCGWMRAAQVGVHGWWW